MTLKLKELEIGKIYECAISKRKVLVIHIQPGHFGGKTPTMTVNGLMFNDVTGNYKQFPIRNGQLKEA